MNQINYLANRFGLHRPKLSRLYSWQDYQRYSGKLARKLKRRNAIESALAGDQEPFYVPGYCYACIPPAVLWEIIYTGKLQQNVKS